MFCKFSHSLLVLFCCISFNFSQKLLIHWLQVCNLGSTVRRVNEGETLDLVVHRKGTGADTTTIRYRTTTNNSLPLQRRAASDVDYQNVDGAVITFRPGVLDVEIGIRVYDDSDPEDDESFIVEV